SERDLIINLEPAETSTHESFPSQVARGHIQISEGWIETGPEDFSGAFQDCDIGEFAAGDLVLAEAKRAQFVQRLKEWRANNAKIVIYFQTEGEDRKSTRLNSSHQIISYAVFCL